MVLRARSRNVELTVDVYIDSPSWATTTFKAVFDLSPPGTSIRDRLRQDVRLSADQEFSIRISTSPSDNKDGVVRRACHEFRAEMVRLVECLETPLAVQETRESKDETATVCLDGVSGLAERAATATFGVVTGLSPRSENRLTNELVETANRATRRNRRDFSVKVPNDGGSIESIANAASERLREQLNALVECADMLSGEPK